MNVKLIKLKSGHDLVAEVISSEQDNITIKNPLNCVILPSGEFMAMPWLEFSKEDTVVLRITDTYIIVDVSNFVGNIYKEKYGGVTTPQTPKLFTP